MTTISIQVPDEEAAEAQKLLAMQGNVLSVELLRKVLTGDVDNAELNASLKRGLDEVSMIENGRSKGLSFEELWND